MAFIRRPVYRALNGLVRAEGIDYLLCKFSQLNLRR